MIKLSAEFYGSDTTVSRLNQHGEFSWLAVAHLMNRFDGYTKPMIDTIINTRTIEQIFDEFFKDHQHNCCYNENKNKLTPRYCKHLLGRLTGYLVHHHAVLGKFINAVGSINQIDINTTLNPVYWYFSVFIRMVIMLSGNVDLTAEQRSIVETYPGINEHRDEYPCDTLNVIFANYNPDVAIWRRDMIILTTAYPELKNVFDCDDAFDYLSPIVMAKKIAKYLVLNDFKCFCDLDKIQSMHVHARMFAMINTICRYIAWKTDTPNCSCESPDKTISSSMFSCKTIEKNEDKSDDNLREIIDAQAKRIKELESMLNLH